MTKKTISSTKWNRIVLKDNKSSLLSYYSGSFKIVDVYQKGFIYRAMIDNKKNINCFRIDTRYKKEKTEVKIKLNCNHINFETELDGFLYGAPCLNSDDWQSHYSVKTSLDGFIKSMEIIRSEFTSQLFDWIGEKIGKKIDSDILIITY